MAKLILIILTCLNGFAAEPTDLLKKMDDMRAYFETHKPVDEDEVILKFPETMRMIGHAIQSKTLDKTKRIHAIVALAAATIPFDHGENTAANFMATDYAKPALTPLYDKEIAALPDEAVRNKLSLGLQKLSGVSP